MGWTARQAHRRAAAVLGMFVVAHLAHHLSGALGGPGVHAAVQGALRVVWRHPVVEPVLLGLLAAQVALGLVLARRRHWRGAQALSGLVLAGFLPVHLGAILMARAAGVDTDLGFAAAGVQDWPWALFFVPYYGLAVWAVVAHGAGGLARVWPRHAGPPCAALTAFLT
jgi:succinate dehydrogenase hydrophobic anchor subunit